MVTSVDSSDVLMFASSDSDLQLGWNLFNLSPPTLNIRVAIVLSSKTSQLKPPEIKSSTYVLAII